MKDGLPKEAGILREQRVYLKMTQEEVAHEVGINLQQYQWDEYGDRDLRKIPMELGLRICRMLGLDPYELIRGDAKP
ncbi:MAG: helix-turn-helix transcriptional regulator [Clostridia bacterium]|nr:helix-turn-helix transcriptional regulator [Clostridia bacterium]